MHDDHAHLRAVLRPVSTPPAENDDDTGLPALIEGAYQPHARPSNKPLTSIHFVSPQGDVRSFQYVDLDSDSRFTAECITLTFTGSTPIRVTIHGRNLWRLYDYVHQCRCRWIMVAVRDFARDGDPHVVRVEFEAIKGEGADADPSNVTET